MRKTVAAAAIALIGILPAAARAQTDVPAPGPVSTLTEVDVPKLLAISGGAVIGVLFFNVLTGNVLSSRVLEDLGRGVGVIAASAMGGWGGYYLLIHRDELMPAAKE